MVALSVWLEICDDAFKLFVANCAVEVVAIGVYYKCGALDVLAIPGGEDKLKVEVEQEAESLGCVELDRTLVFGVAHVEGS